MFGPEIRDNPHPAEVARGRAVHEWFVRAVAGCQEAEQLPEGVPVELAALIGVAGHAEEEKGLSYPSGPVRLLLLHLCAARRP